MKILKLIVLTMMAVSCVQVKAQTVTEQNSLAYFVDQWQGTGKFANGKTITATLRFAFELDSNYLIGRHRDDAPGRFRADSYWRVDEKSGKLKSILMDNSGTERIFTGEGTLADSLVFSRSFEVAVKGTVCERFIYKVLDRSRFRMEYQVRIAEKPWRMIDYLIFHRKQ